MNWKEVVVAYLMYYPGSRAVGLRKTMRNLRIASLQAEIWIRDLLNTKQEF
jgi:hypothetical protein